MQLVSDIIRLKFQLHGIKNKSLIFSDLFLIYSCCASIVCSEELDTDGFAEGDVLMGVGEEACVGVAPEDLDFVAVAATA